MNCKIFKAALLAAALCLGTLATPALAQVNVSINLGVPPPPPRHEIYEEPRQGYVLLPGYWFWDGHQHRWAEHRWVEDRPGQRWEPPRWEQRGNKHHFKPGRWERVHADKGYKGHRDKPQKGHDRR